MGRRSIRGGDERRSVAEVSGETQRRVIVGLSVLCALLVIVTTWALATRDRGAPESPVYWVATGGDDSAPGTSDEPWATLQKAADTVPPGAVVYVRGGTYAQRVELHISGEPGRPVTFRPAPNETVVLDGSSLEVPAEQSAMIAIDSERYITIQGFEITGYESDVSGRVPIGILVTGAADHVRLEGNFVHDMGTTFEGRSGGDAHGIGVFGTTGDHPIEGVEIVDNELANLMLGSSEALVVNGNVKDFLIEGNRVHDTNNIGIDVIGFEERRRTRRSTRLATGSCEPTRCGTSTATATQRTGTIAALMASTWMAVATP
jgi:pectate lyase-like protein